MSTYEFPFTIKYVPDWTLKDAMREFISNARDAEVQHGAKMTLGYDADARVAKIISLDTALPRSTLLMGGSDKRDDPRLIGRHHEGMKMAMLVCARNHIPVKIRNGTSEDWRPYLEYSAKWGDTILMVEAKPAKRQRNNFEVEIGGLEPELWAEVQRLFLFLRPQTRTISTPRGQLLLDKDLAGEIFVKGVYVTREDLIEGYNFNYLDLDRDRNIPPRYEMNGQMKLIWLESLAENPEHIARIYKMLNNNEPEADAFRYSSDDALLHGLVKTFQTQHGEDAVPVVSTDEVEALALCDGRRGAVVSPILAGRLHELMPSLAKIRMARRTLTTKVYQPDELTEDERRVFDDAYRALTALPEVRTLEGRVSVVDFNDPKLQGTHKGETIQIARRLLSNYGELLAVLVHEVAHDFGDDGSHSHTEAIHRLTASLFNRSYTRGESLQAGDRSGGTEGTAESGRGDPDDLPF